MELCIFRDFILTLSLWNVCMCSDIDDVAPADEEDGSKPGVISFKQPSLNDEESHSHHMPSSLKCDGCLVVAYQLSEGFNKVQSRYPTKRLTESQIFDITDSVCAEGFERYGLKEYKGRKCLSGPGMPANEAPGMMQGGGKWPNRLTSMCGNYVGELGEEELYDAYREDNKLVNTLCHGKGIFGNCVENEKDEL